MRQACGGTHSLSSRVFLLYRGVAEKCRNMPQTTHLRRVHRWRQWKGTLIYLSPFLSTRAQLPLRHCFAWQRNDIAPPSHPAWQPCAACISSMLAQKGMKGRQVAGSMAEPRAPVARVSMASSRKRLAPRCVAEPKAPSPPAASSPAQAAPGVYRSAGRGASAGKRVQGNPETLPGALRGRETLPGGHAHHEVCRQVLLPALAPNARW